MTTAASARGPRAAQLQTATSPHISTSPPTATADVLTQSIPTDLLPLNLLSCNWQLPPECLERALAQTAKCLVQILLVLLLLRRDLPHDLARVGATSDAQIYILVGEQPHVAVLVVVHVDLDGACESAG